MMKFLQATIVFLFFSVAIRSQNFVEAQEIREVSQFEIDVFIEFIAPGIQAKNPVLLLKILYETPGIHGELDTASGLLALPSGGAEPPFPVLMYHHGTANYKTDIPSEVQTPMDLKAPFEIAFASQGYIVCSADYLGLGESRGFHPYVHAETEARASIHFYEAILDYLDWNGYELDGHLFVSGYSQGGHAAMATHRELQTNYYDAYFITASAPASGPYSISTSMKNRILSDEEYFYPGFIAYTLHSYQTVYGDLYDEFEEIYRQPYASIIEEELLKEDYSIKALHDSLIAALVSEMGSSVPRFILQDSILYEIEEDPDHRINQLLRLNDTYDWKPEAPMRLFYCENDDQVTYLNSILADSVMNENGAEDVAALSSGPLLNHMQCAIPATIASLTFFNSFLVPSNIDQVNPGVTIVAYPNPADDYLTIHLPENSNVEYQLELTDPNGQVVMSQELYHENLQIATDDLSPGFYTLLLKSASTAGSKKIMIIR